MPPTHPGKSESHDVNNRNICYAELPRNKKQTTQQQTRNAKNQTVRECNPPNTMRQKANN